MTWQPIETAPKGERTFIDLWCINTMGEEHYGPGYRFTDCYWMTELTQVPRWVKRDNDETVEDCGWIATHWQPLPEPPAHKARTEGEVG